MKKVTKKTMSNEIIKEYCDQLNTINLTELDASQIASIYITLAVTNVRLPEKINTQDFSNVIAQIAHTSFRITAEYESEIGELTKCFFDIRALPILLKSFRKDFPTDDVYSLYLYRWAITKGYELRKLVGNDVDMMFNKLIKLDFLDEEILGSEDEAFDLSKSLPSGEVTKNQFTEMCDKYGGVLEFLLKVTSMNEELSLYEKKPETCTKLFVLGKRTGDLTYGEIKIEKMLFGTQEERNQLGEIFDIIPMFPELKEFVKDKYEVCSRIFGVGIYFENISIQNKKVDMLDFSALEDYFRTRNPLSASLLVG